MTPLILNKNIYININLSNCSTRFKGFYAINRFDTRLHFISFVFVSFLTIFQFKFLIVHARPIISKFIWKWMCVSARQYFFFLLSLSPAVGICHARVGGDGTFLRTPWFSRRKMPPMAEVSNRRRCASQPTPYSTWPIRHPVNILNYYIMIDVRR